MVPLLLLESTGVEMFGEMKITNMNNSWVKVLKCLILNLLSYQKYK